MKKILSIILITLFYSTPSFSATLPKDVVSGSKFKKSLTGNYYKKYGMKVVNKSDGHPVRLGKKSIRFELRSGDCDQKKPTSYNDCKADPPAERHELGQEYDKVALSGETWHTYSLFIPEDTPQINSEWITMGQFHNLDYHKPPVNLDLVGKHFEIVQDFFAYIQKDLIKDVILMIQRMYEK